MAFCDTIARIGFSFQTQGHTESMTEPQMDGQTYVEVEIVIKILSPKFDYVTRI